MATNLRPSRPTPRGAVERGSARERLLASANELFYADGVQTVGIDRVIEHAGVAKGSLYNLFGSKEGLVRAYLACRHVEQAAGDFRTQMRALFTELAEQAGVSDRRTLARQLQVIYDGAGLAAGMDRDPSIATSARAAAEALLDASL